MAVMTAREAVPLDATPPDLSALSPCKKCGQVDIEQYGEYPCQECGLPTLFEPPIPSADAMSAVLRIYAKHRNDEEMFCEALKHSDYPCTCGLGALLAELDQAPQGEKK